MKLIKAYKTLVNSSMDCFWKNDFNYINPEYIVSISNDFYRDEDLNMWYPIVVDDAAEDGKKHTYMISHWTFCKLTGTDPNKTLPAGESND